MKVGYRKLFLAVLFSLIGLGVELTTKNGLTPGLVELFMGLYAAFAVGNISEHWAGIRKGAAAVPVSVTDPELHGKVGDLQDKADHLLQSQQVAQQALEFLVGFVQKASANAPQNVS